MPIFGWGVSQSALFLVHTGELITQKDGEPSDSEKRQACCEAPRSLLTSDGLVMFCVSEASQKRRSCMDSRSASIYRTSSLWLRMYEKSLYDPMIQPRHGFMAFVISLGFITHAVVLSLTVSGGILAPQVSKH